MSRRTLVIMTIMSVLVANATAQNAGLSLTEALALAQTGHPALAVAEAEVTAAEARAEQAGAWPNPAAFFRVEAAPRSGDSWRGSERILGLSQVFPWGGRTGAARAVATAEAGRTSHEQTLAARSVEASVRAAFAEALHARDAVLLREDALRVARRVHELTEFRVAADDAAVLDLRRARMELGEAQAGLGQARVAASATLDILAAAMGVGGNQVAGVRGDLAIQSVVPDLDSLLAAIAVAPRTQIAAARVRQSDALVTEASRLRRPDLELEFGLRTSPEGDSFDAGVRIDLPILDGGGARLSAARAGEVAAQYQTRVLQQDLTARVRRAHAELTVAVDNAAIYDEVVVPEATAALESTEVAYTAGAAGITDVLQITRDWIAAKEKRLDLLLAAQRARAVLVDLL